MPVHGFKWFRFNSFVTMKIKPRSRWRLAAIFTLLTAVCNEIKGNSALNKMTPVWCRLVKRFKSYRTFYVLASYHFMEGKIRGSKTQMQPDFWRIQS
jgi:hypothetical protein